MKTSQNILTADVVNSAAVPAASMDPSRRPWITTTTVLGGTGLVATAVPFVTSLAPSEKARALGAAVEVDLQRFLPGELKIVEWRGKPVWILWPSPAQQTARAPASLRPRLIHRNRHRQELHLKACL